MKNILLLFVSLFICVTLSAQVAAPIVGGNVIKFNLSSVDIQHYNIQYERALALNRSVCLGFGYSSGVDLPFKNTLIDQFGDNEDARRALETTKLDKLTITPEYRFYFSAKGAPIGFYLATFIRYTRLGFSQDYTFTPSDNTEHITHIDGNLNGVGGGAMIGIQWALGSSFTLDWWILGPFAGIQNGSFDAVGGLAGLTEQDRVDLEQDIEDIEIPFWNIDATVGENTATAEISGPFVGVRTLGFSLGYRF
jgi:hypothetical protein